MNQTTYVILGIAQIILFICSVLVVLFHDELKGRIWAFIHMIISLYSAIALLDFGGWL